MVNTPAQLPLVYNNNILEFMGSLMRQTLHMK